MKVVLLAPTPPPAGGIAGWTARMIKAKLGHEWYVTVVDEKLVGKREVFGDKTKINILSEIKRCFKIWRKLRIELKDKETKIIHSCIPSRTFAMLREYICAILTKIYRKKFIIHFRCTIPNTTQGILGNFFLKRLCNISDFIITLNSQSEEYLSNITKTPSIIVPNFISKEEIRESHTIRDNINKVLYVGGVIESKGAIDMLKVAKNFKHIEFRFVGKIEQKVLNFAKENNLNNAIFLGAQDKEFIKKELEEADVFMFLTYFFGEGFSNALAEAMAAGLPCIVTDWAANADMIGGNGGFVVQIKSPEEASVALKKAFPKYIRKRQSDYNISKVSQCYVDEVILSKYIDIYSKLI